MFKRKGNKLLLITLLLMLLIGGTISYAEEIVELEEQIEHSNENNFKEEVVIISKTDKRDEELQLMFAGEKGLSLYEHPFLEANILSNHSHGDKVDIIRILPEGWIKVEINGIIGFTKEEMLIDKYTPIAPDGSEMKANMIYILNRSVPYKNTGELYCQSQIDKHPETAATFGGAPTFSGTDNHNTHFAAHNYGAFNGIWNMKKGEQFIITDSNNNPFIYEVNNIKKVTYDGFGYDDGVDYWNQITGYGNTERVTLQTCIFGDNNGVWILDAHQVSN